MSKIEKLVEDLSGLTVLEAADLAKLLEEKWGVSAAAPAAAAATGAAAEIPRRLSMALTNSANSRTVKPVTSL